ncbi:hypothetical protein C8J57DRAFT_1250002 [Mycena rebaudengoi]|nr:hypothetical protein C8J57DRAFT_1250002 [Mycena rebaudengoi]
MPDMLHFLEFNLRLRTNISHSREKPTKQTSFKEFYKPAHQKPTFTPTVYALDTRIGVGKWDKIGSRKEKAGKELVGTLRAGKQGTAGCGKACEPFATRQLGIPTQ